MGVASELGAFARAAPRAYVLIVALLVLESYAYFATSLALVVHARTHWAASDVEAASLYGAWGAAMGVAGALAGPLIDALGVERALVVGALVSAAGRVALVAAPTLGAAAVALVLVQAAGAALAAPVLTIAVRRAFAAEPRALATAYGVYYAAMNAAALAAALVADIGLDAPRARTERALVGAALASLVYAALALVARALLRAPRATYDAIALHIDDADDDADAPPPAARLPERPSARAALVDAWRDPVAWRFVGFSLALAGARSVFRHVDATLPTYLERTLGARARYGAIAAINPALVIVFAPFVQAALRSRDAYACVVAGTAATALAPALLALGGASYARAAAAMLVLAAGELVYSPLLYTYAMALAPPGREGTYSTLASSSLVAIKALVGPASGALLATYCASGGVDAASTCPRLWAWVAAGGATTPLVLVAARRALYTDAVRARIAAAAR